MLLNVGLTDDSRASWKITVATLVVRTPLYGSATPTGSFAC